MLRFAVTGGIACGKTLAGEYLAADGVAVFDADVAARDLMQPGTAVFAEVVRAFGRGILDPEGRIDRSALGARVFATPRDLATLNRLVHPATRRAWEAWLAAPETARVATAGAAAVIVPLLFEGGMSSGWDAVVCVAAAERVQVERLLARGMTGDEARARIRAQAPVEMKATLSDYVLVNEGTRATLREQTRRVLERILEGKHGDR
ncbi:MAG: dephospho-CoA kinase [Lentisphaerae bacterium]|nr:dephospho-CoA kinase [Lentisphaerota bacterium]